MRIRAVREELGMGINELAKHLRVERRRLANWEHGRHLPNDERAMILLCDMSDATLDWIYRASFEGMPRSLGSRLASRVLGEVPPPRRR